MKKIKAKIKSSDELPKKMADVKVPKLESVGAASLFLQPGYVSGSYTNKKGNTFSADYDKFNKSFSVGAKLNIGKKKK